MSNLLLFAVTAFALEMNPENPESSKPEIISPEPRNSRSLLASTATSSDFLVIWVSCFYLSCMHHILGYFGTLYRYRRDLVYHRADQNITHAY